MSFVCSIRSVAAFLAISFGLAVTGWSQSDLSTITGTVKDSTGGNVPNAKVFVRNEGTGVSREIITNDSGTYTVSSIPAGRYTVTVEASGFKKYEKSGNLLDANLPLGVDVTLEVGAITESVNVTAEASVIQTESATLGVTVDQYQVQNLMLNGRNPVLLASLKPGVRSSASLANFNFNLTDGGFSMNGSRPNDNVFFQDGAVATRTRSNGTSIGAADVDSTEEVQVLTANYNAEYGRSGGGQIRVITKSGSRDFHGTAYEFFRNSAMDANTWARNVAPISLLNSSPQPLKYNQFGFNVSGPIFIPGKFNRERNKLFFLFGEEWVRYRTSPVNASGGTTVPSLLMRQGNFSELLASNPFFGKPYVVVDPNTGNPYPGNIIPKSAQSVNGMALLNAYPMPTPGFQLGSSNYIVSNNEIDNTRKDTLSVDVLPTEKDTIRLRVLNYNYYVANAFQGNFTLAANQLNRPNQTASLNYIHVFSPTLINEALVTASADHVDITLRGNAWDRTQYGVNYPYLYGAAAKDLPNKLATININGFGQLDNGPYPSRSGGPIYGYSDNVTWIHGSHTVKAGFLYELAGQNDRDQVNVTGTPGGANNQNGRFDFQDTSFFGNTNPGIADLALGRFTSYAEIGPRDYTISRGDMYEFFVQDSWKVNSKLKLDLGFRETILQPYHALWGNYDVFDARFYDPAKAVQIDPKTGTIIPGSGNIYNGIVIPGSHIPSSGLGRFPNSTDPVLQTLFHGLPDTYAGWQFNNFVPRIGVAYQLNDKTVLRTAFGGFKNRPAVSDATFLGGNFPFQGYEAVSNGSVDNPGSASGGTPTQFIQTQDPVWKTPTSYEWNATVQRELPFSSNIEVSYVGRVGLHLERIRNENQLPVGTCPNGTCPGGVNVNFLVPYKGFNQIQIAEMAARSSYNGLNVAWNRRFTKGFSFGASYTLSKSYDNASGRRDILWNNYDATNFWGPSSFDTRQILVINWIYEIPYKRTNGFSGTLLGGWQVTGITQFQTGTPFSVTTGSDYAGIGVSQNQPWQVNGSVSYPQQFSTGGAANYWLSPVNSSGAKIFTVPTAGTFANQTRNLYYGAGFQNWNLGIFKTFKLTEKSGIVFRAEAFNWLNHPNWAGANGGSPNTNPTSSAFGEITSKDSRRQMQLSLKYQF
jgi:hypothetical protein